jgi:hypothetical protein
LTDSRAELPDADHGQMRVSKADDSQALDLQATFPAAEWRRCQPDLIRGKTPAEDFDESPQSTLENDIRR